MNTGSWASEALPLSVRKELLQRELRKLGIRRTPAHAGASADAAAAQQHGQSSQHPQAGACGPADTHAD